MSENDEVHRTIIDRDSLPERWPTHRHEPEFWEQLGRTVATYGFLEEVLGKAIFAYTATRHFKTEADVQVAYGNWILTLERALIEPLVRLTDTYAAAIRNNSKNTTDNLDELVDAIKQAAVIRNVICHGSWRAPDAEGRSLPLFINKQKEIFETPIDIAYLNKLQRHVAEL